MSQDESQNVTTKNSHRKYVRVAPLKCGVDLIWQVQPVGHTFGTKQCDVDGSIGARISPTTGFYGYRVVNTFGNSCGSLANDVSCMPKIKVQVTLKNLADNVELRSNVPKIYHVILFRVASTTKSHGVL